MLYRTLSDETRKQRRIERVLILFRGILTPGKRSKVAPRLGEAVFFYVRCFSTSLCTFPALGAMLGPFWGHLGAILGPSWGHLGAPEAISGSLGSVLAPFGPVSGPFWAPFRPSWGLLGPSWGHLKPFWGHLGASWSLLGASWKLLEAILGSSRSLRTAKTKTRDLPTII